MTTQEDVERVARALYEAEAAPKEWGFWKTMFWPVQLGKRLVRDFT